MSSLRLPNIVLWFIDDLFPLIMPAHLAYHVHKSGRKILIIFITTNNALCFEWRHLKMITEKVILK